MTTAEQGAHRKVVGPDAALTQVLQSYERDGHSDPSAAWALFTATWNWAAPLPTASPANPSAVASVARPVPGGFSLSGLWHMPSGAGQGRWLALPRADGQQHCQEDAAGRGIPDVFVISSNVLPRSSHRRAVGSADASDQACRLDAVYVPGGFATSSGGTPLRAEDAAFLWTAVTAMALGAARRMTDVLATLAPDASSAADSAAMPPAAAAAELATALHDAWLRLAVKPHSASHAGPGARLSTDDTLAAQVGRAGHLVHNVVAAAYEYAAPFAGDDGHHPLLSLIESSTPVLQLMRFAVELLPPDNTISTREGQAT